MIIRVENGVIPEIGKTYIFLNHGYLKIGLCVKNPSSKPVYDWAMKGVDDGKMYYPYDLDIIDTNVNIQEVIPSFNYKDLY